MVRGSDLQTFVRDLHAGGHAAFVGVNFKLVAGMEAFFGLAADVYVGGGAAEFKHVNFSIQQVTYRRHPIIIIIIIIIISILIILEDGHEFSVQTAYRHKHVDFSIHQVLPSAATPASE
jgi:hypothetical protein